MGSNFHVDLINNLYLDSELSDIILLGSDNVPIRAHKTILAASCDYFKKRYLKNRAMSEIHFDDTPSEVILTFLMFVYRGEIEIDSLSELEMIKLYALCREIELHSLLEIVRQKFMDIEISFENLDEMFKQTRNDLQTKSKCLTFIDENSEKIIGNTDMFINFSYELVTEMLPRDTFFEKELNIFMAVEKWLENHENEEPAKRRKLLDCIRLNQLDQREYAAVRKSKLALFCSDSLTLDSEYFSSVANNTFSPRSKATIANESNIEDHSVCIQQSVSEIVRKVEVLQLGCEKETENVSSSASESNNMVNENCGDGFECSPENSFETIVNCNISVTAANQSPNHNDSKSENEFTKNQNSTENRCALCNACLKKEQLLEKEVQTDEMCIPNKIEQQIDDDVKSSVSACERSESFMSFNEDENVQRLMMITDNVDSGEYLQSNTESMDICRRKGEKYCASEYIINDIELENLITCLTVDNELLIPSIYTLLELTKILNEKQKDVLGTSGLIESLLYLIYSVGNGNYSYNLCEEVIGSALSLLYSLMGNYKLWTANYSIINLF
ncbi:BTB and poz domain-containing protein-like protein [Leptotrombidium deliense]|uniref:BTB and poz domain-containing protein-like protein n=1 Tax=Leptotrombidium deliense TaxID=299467 RepID=A0A443SIH3_9ACAR|nr:BTB and poz domain-containing protein-like protein [Leptotrombidium deliense]